MRCRKCNAVMRVPRPPRSAAPAAVPQPPLPRSSKVKEAPIAAARGTAPKPRPAVAPPPPTPPPRFVPDLASKHESYEVSEEDVFYEEDEASPTANPPSEAPPPSPARVEPLKREPRGSMPGPRTSWGPAMYAKLAAGLLVCGLSYMAAYKVVRMAMGAGASGEPTTIVDADATGPVVVPDTSPPRNEPAAANPLPVFPAVGPGIEIEPGVTWRKIKLKPPREAIGDPPPGHLQTLWLYLPKGDHAPGSLPCILIAPAGSNLLTGNAWEGAGGDEGRHPEHLPYVRAGFAVLAYELDGAIPENADQDQFLRGVRKFLDARAGLADAHIAVEFLKAKVPQVDPKRIFAAGHSSAGTTALLVAANEPGIAGCVAFAPCINLRSRFAQAGDVDEIIDDLRRAVPGSEALFSAYSPIENESKIRCPVFLFHAEDDDDVPVAESRAFVERAGGQARLVSLETAPSGGHYQAMIDDGIDRAIRWLRDERHALDASESRP